MPGPFRSFANRYWQNLEGSQTTYARAGIFELPTGVDEPAVIIFRDKFCMAILTTADATRLADELIDAIERPVVK